MEEPYKKFPSVTTVLKPWIDVKWMKEEHRERGSAVHRAISTHLKGLWSPPLPVEYQGYLDSAKRWLDAMVDEIVMVEERLIDQQKKYHGKPDLLAKLKGDDSGIITLVDWKTAVAIHKTCPIQIAAYRNLAKADMKGTETHRGMSNRLKKDGKMPLVDEYKNYALDFNIFLSALNTYNYFTGG